ncbi:MCP four helix bundle domain-containing protein [Xanthomonas theicola]|uniref:Chemotaxis protein n=1 Tax=Xanthomonas theicola TaxID=56464 RepID=A0A2S6ZIR2_9XANT|nr:MCP four helix bundle domain-containing protein [Xanthomonas theicola]PPT92163.1 chemotaxis protein [Xanthomonas theicola]QNH24216.1 chemotaxis protein [Xanthomonas theicola]
MPRHIDLKSSLIASLLCLLGAGVVVAAARLSTHTLDESRERLQRLQIHQAPSAMALRELRAQLAELGLYEMAQIAWTGDAAEVADHDRRMQRVLQGVREQLAIYKATTPDGEEARRFAEIQAKLDRYLQLHRQLGATVHAGDRDRAGRLAAQQLLPLRRTLLADLMELSDLNAERAQQSAASGLAYAVR